MDVVPRTTQTPALLASIPSSPSFPRLPTSLFQGSTRYYVRRNNDSTRESAEFSVASTFEQRFIALFLAFPSKLIRESFLLVDAKFAKRKCIIRRTFRAVVALRKKSFRVISISSLIFRAVSDKLFLFRELRELSIGDNNYGYKFCRRSLLLPDTRRICWFCCFSEDTRRMCTGEK